MSISYIKKHVWELWVKFLRSKDKSQFVPSELCSSYSLHCWESLSDHDFQLMFGILDTAWSMASNQIWLSFCMMQANIRRRKNLLKSSQKLVNWTKLPKQKPYFSIETKFSRRWCIVFSDKESDSSPACACSTCSPEHKNHTYQIMKVTTQVENRVHIWF